MNINTVTYSAVLFRADFVARSSRIAVDMLLARASSARKIPRRLRHRVYVHDHLVSTTDSFVAGHAGELEKLLRHLGYP
jgi:hypothetical protein